MRTPACWAAVLVVASAGVASSQGIPAGLVQYLKLTEAQVASIGQLNTDFAAYGAKVWADYQQLNDAATTELAKDAPDANAVGSGYAQIEALRRDYVAHQNEVQSKIAALLTPDQAVAIAALVRAERIQGLAEAAGCLGVGSGLAGPYTSSCSNGPPSAPLIDYLHLTSNQVISWNSILQSFSADQLLIQLRIAEANYAIDDLTAATPVDREKLGAAYVARQKIYRDRDDSSAQMPRALRALLTDEQLGLLQALVDANALAMLAQTAACFNILVQPKEFQQSRFYFLDPKAPPYIGYCYYSASTAARKELR